MTLPTVTFTPPVACTVNVTAMFDGQYAGSGSDWSYSSGGGVRIYFTQSGTTSYSDQQPMSMTRIRYGIQYSFSAAAGAAVTCGIQLTSHGLASTTAWNTDLKVEVIKR